VCTCVVRAVVFVRSRPRPREVRDQLSSRSLYTYVRTSPPRGCRDVRPRERDSTTSVYNKKLPCAKKKKNKQKRRQKPWSRGFLSLALVSPVYTLFFPVRDRVESSGRSVPIIIIDTLVLTGKTVSKRFRCRECRESVFCFFISSSLDFCYDFTRKRRFMNWRIVFRHKPTVRRVNEWCDWCLHDI